MIGQTASSNCKIMKKTKTNVQELVTISAIYHNEVGVISLYFIDDKLKLEYSTMPGTKQTFNKYYKNKTTKS